MKHTTEQLLLAALVRDRVAKLLAFEQPAGLSEEAGARWRNENAERYTAKAVDELKMFAEFIERAQSA